MTIDAILLEKLAEWRPDTGRQSLSVASADGVWKVALTADAADVVGCRVWELILTRSAPVADLKGWASRAAEQVTGLLEPLKLLEVDEGLSTALLRSQEPGQRGEALHYYELHLTGAGTATVRRFQARRDSGRREQIALP
jgi:hypothetical protein